MDRNAHHLHEGLVVFGEGVTVEQITVEATAKGHALPVASGTPDYTGWVPAPVEDLDTYHMTRLTIVARDGRRWTITNPPQSITLAP